MFDNKTKHEDLEQSELRDFLAKELKWCGYDGEVEVIKSQIKDLEIRLEKVRSSQIAKNAVRLNGWLEHDVSDHVEQYISDEYFPFVGTDEELDTLLKKK